MYFPYVRISLFTYLPAHLHYIQSISVFTFSTLAAAHSNYPQLTSSLGNTHLSASLSSSLRILGVVRLKRSEDAVQIILSLSDLSLTCSLRILGVVGLERSKDTVQIVLSFSGRWRLTRSSRVFGVVGLERRKDAVEIVADGSRVAATELDLHGRGGGFGVFWVDFAQGFEDRGDVVLGIGLRGWRWY
jgi:hypothetical protein